MFLLKRLATASAATRFAISQPRISIAQNFVRFSSTINKINTESVVSKYSEGPILIKYTPEHEWLAAHPDGTTFIGITAYAADALGDATYIELPEVSDEIISAGDSIGSVESVKSASEIYSPVNGEIVEVNEKLNESPELINNDPMGDGWFAKIKVLDVAQLSEGELMDEKEYQSYLEEQE